MALCHEGMHHIAVEFADEMRHWKAKDSVQSRMIRAVQLMERKWKTLLLLLVLQSAERDKASHFGMEIC